MTQTVKDLLRIEVAPALGCTEPVAIALAAAAAASLLAGETPETIEISVDPNIYKNGIAVTIPGTPGLSGLDLAGAIGALGGDANLRLEVLAPVDDVVAEQASAFVAAGKVKVNLLADHKGLFIKVVVTSVSARAEAVIEGLHDNIVHLKRDDEVILDHPLLVRSGAGQGQGDLDQLEAWLKGLSLAELFKLIDSLDDDDRAFLQEGLDHNMRLAEYGLKHGPVWAWAKPWTVWHASGLSKRI